MHQREMPSRAPFRRPRQCNIDGPLAAALSCILSNIVKRSTPMAKPTPGIAGPPSFLNQTVVSPARRHRALGT